MASSTASETPRAQVSPTADTSPSYAVEREEEPWSGEDDGNGSDEGDEGDVVGGGKRKRQRVSRPISVSCEKCKERKVKCDRGQPRCAWCVRNNQLCEYRERKKPGLRAGYGRLLESRLDKLEGVLESQQQALLQLASKLPGGQLASPIQPRPLDIQAEAASFVQTPNMYQVGSPHTGRYSSRSDVSVPQPQMPTPTARPHHQSPQQALQPTRSSSGDIYNSLHMPLDSPSLHITGSAQASLSEGGALNAVSQDQDFPPYDLLYSLTDLFFKHINTWCPILHRRTTLDSLLGSSTLEEADRILLHAIVATTLRFLTDGRLNDQSREFYHSTSKQKVLLYGLENSSVKALQALVILALDIVGTSNGPPGWNLLGLIARSVVQLGLAVEITSTSLAPLYPSIYTLRAMVLPEAKTFIEDESRRRLFWMVYLLDRYATISTAFEFALDEKEIDRKLPCRDDLFGRNQPVDTRWFYTAQRHDYSMNKPENLGSFSHYVEIIGIVSKIHQFLKQPIDISALHDVEVWQMQYRQLDRQLNEWNFNLPNEYGNMSRIFNPGGQNKIVNCIWIMLHITYHTAVIRLHSSAAYPTNRSQIFAPSYSASQRCLAAVENICALCSYVRMQKLLTQLGPPFAWSLWVAARLLLVHGSTIDHRVNPAIHPLVETLQEMGVYWKVAERYASLLARVLEEYSESERAPPGANGVRETPSTVRILADMRRTAYDLDFLISRQPRQYFGSKVNNPTPARTPAPNELELLDVFDFFNLPRLSAEALSADVQAFQAVEGGVSNEFNTTNFMYDADSDWFMKNPT